MDDQRAKFDSQDLHAVISAMPNQILRAWDFTKVTFSEMPENIYIFGMGGSALPANIFITYLKNEISHFNFPIHIIRDYDLPVGFDQNSGGIFISYSGNTEETLSAFKQALETGNRNLIVMATGGQLENLAEDNKIPFIKIPDDVKQPRFGYGYFLGALMKIFNDSKLIEIDIEDIKLQLKNILNSTEQLERQGKDLAQTLENKIPIIYTSDKWKYLAMVIKINFNENSKIQSFWNTFPELNHNEMVGFTKLLAEYSIIIFKDPQDNEKVIKRIHALEQIMNNQVPVQIIEMPQAQTLTKIFSTLLIGLWASYYLALKYQVDPAPVKMVEDFKNKIK